MIDETIEKIKLAINYDHVSGEFKWRDSRRKNCGYINEGYLRIKLDGKKYFAHRIAWVIHYGFWHNIVDHINGIKLDNKIKNLRNVDQKINAQNRRSANTKNKSGFIGVSQRGNKFVSSIYMDGKGFYLGAFKTAEEAHERYLEEKRIMHKGCTV